MAPPYNPGQTLAWLAPDPAGIRVHPAIVQTIEPAEGPTSSTARWLVTTDRGAATVDDTGVGATAVPIDTEIDTELYVHGGDYLVRATVMELQRTLDQDSALDLDDDLGLD